MIGVEVDADSGNIDEEVDCGPKCPEEEEVTVVGSTESTEDGGVPTSSGPNKLLKFSGIVDT